MRELKFVALLLVAAVLVGGCTVKIGNPETPSTPSSGPAATTGAAPAEESGPRIVLLQVGDKYDATAKEVTHQTDVFTPETPVIEVNAGIKGLKTDAVITGALTAVEVTTKDGTKVRDHEVAATEMKAPGEESTVHFSFKAPTAGWPKGDYKVEISVEGKVIETVPVTVK